MYYGGNRTGRWAGRLLQVQNLPQTHLDDCELCRDLIKSGDFDALELVHEDLPDTMKQLIRTALVAPEGKTFVVCDYSAIEARLLAWIAGETGGRRRSPTVKIFTVSLQARCLACLL